MRVGSIRYWGRLNPSAGRGEDEGDRVRRGGGHEELDEDAFEEDDVLRVIREGGGEMARDI